MVHDKKVESVVAVGSFVAAVALAFTSLLISEDHDIAAGVLMMCAQFLMLTATIFGLDYKISQKIKDFKAGDGVTSRTAGLILFCLMIPSSFAVAQPFVQAKHLTYDVIYDYGRMSPAAVTYVLQASDFTGSQRQKPKHFKMDRRLPPPRVKNSQFTFSGYQRGHLCPSGDRDARKDWFRDTFYTSNIVPMTPDVNAGVWKEIENQLRATSYHGHTIRIACGPLWKSYHGTKFVAAKGFTAVSNTIHESMVPSHLWKMVRCIIHPGEEKAYLVENRNGYQCAADCVIDTDSLMTLINPTISSYVLSWIRK